MVCAFSTHMRCIEPVVNSGRRILALRGCEEGQNLVEYTLMIGLVVLGIWLGVNASGIDASLSTIWSKVRSVLSSS